MPKAPKVAWGVGALASIICVRSVYLVFDPPGRVEVTIRHLPADTYFVCVAVAGDQGLVSLNWLASGKGVPFEMHPSDCLCSRPERDWTPELPCAVVWREYGVITRDPKGGWRAAWFPATEVPMTRWMPVLGSRRAEFDCLGRATVSLTAEQVRSLGLEDVIDHPL